MNQTIITLTGTIGGDVVSKRLTDGAALVTFRLVVNTRRWDLRTKAFVDGPSSWYAVKCWRELGVNAEQSLGRGDRVVVQGKLRVREWVDDDGKRRYSADVDAEAIGHDLRWGVSRFTRVSRVDTSRDPIQEEADEVMRQLEADPRPDLADLLGADAGFDSTAPVEPDGYDDSEDDLDDDEPGDEHESEEVDGRLVAAGRR